jgi:hypothetical protein
MARVLDAFTPSDRHDGARRAFAALAPWYDAKLRKSLGAG